MKDENNISKSSKNVTVDIITVGRHSILFRPNIYIYVMGTHFSSKKARKRGECYKVSTVESSVEEDSGNSIYSICPAGPHRKNQIFVATEDNLIRLRDIHTNSIKGTWGGHSAGINQVVHGIQRGIFYTCSRDSTVKAWNAKITTPNESVEATTSVTNAFTTEFCGHKYSVSCISLDDSECKLLSGGRDAKICLWDLNDPKSPVASTTLSRNIVTDISWIPKSDLFVQTSEDLTMRLWDSRILSSGSNIKTRASQTFTGYLYIPTSVTVSSDGYYVFTGSKGCSFSSFI